MKRNYFDQKEKKFYFQNKNDKKIDYELLYSKLINMKESNQNECNYYYEKEKEFFKIKIIRIISEKAFEFQINGSLSLNIFDKKKIFFQNEKGNIENEIMVYNNEQLLEVQDYLVDIYKTKNIEFFDKYDKLIYKKDDIIDFFNKAQKLKIVSDNPEKIITGDFYKSIFERYINKNYENNGQQLSFNFIDYSGEKPDVFNFVETDERNNFFLEMNHFIYSKDNYVAISGISGTGKTITLLQYLLNLSYDYSECYFNIKVLYKTSNIKKLASEFVKLFYKQTQYKYYEQLIKLIEQKNNLLIWDKIIKILDFAIDTSDIKKTIVIVIDQYKLGYDPNLKLFEILRAEKYSSKIKFIICSSIHERDMKSNITYSTINKQLGLKNIFLYKFISNLLSVEKIIKNNEIKNMMKQFNYIPKYYYIFINNYHKDEEKVNDEVKLKESIKKFLSFNFGYLENKLRSFYVEKGIDIKEVYNNICQILQGNLVNEVNFQNIIQLIPLKYCIFENKDDKYFQITPAFELIYGPLRKIYKETTINDMIKIAHLSQIKNRGELGNIFDSLVNSNFDIGKKFFGLEISHVIIVNEIITFAYIRQIIHNDIDYLSRQIDYKRLKDGKTIYLEQYNSNGQCVDGGFLIPNKNDSYDLLLYQSSIKKRNRFSKEFIYNFIYETTKYNIKQTLRIDIDKIYFVYIIDKDDHSMIKYCIESEIYYLFYNYESSKFLYNNSKEMKDFNSKIFNKMEIQKPNPEKIKLFKLQEEKNDLLPFKPVFLTQKRNLETDTNSKEKKTELKETQEDIRFKETKYGFKNEDAKLKEAKISNFEESSIEESKPNVKKALEDLPKNWKTIFNEYDSYQFLKKNLPGYHSIFPLPIFYTYENKYLIVKSKDTGNIIGNYSFYDFKTGKKLEGKPLKNALDLFQIQFFNSDKDIFCVNAYRLTNK